MNGGYLAEAYQRFHRTGPEWGANQLTNHGPMAVEVLVRRGYAETVTGWTDRYIDRLEPLPAGTGRISADGWRDALGDGRRLTDWTGYFGHELADQPWRQVLATWWPRLLPGIVAGTTHGVIRVGHAVRALLAGSTSQPTVDELAHGLAFWAARARPVPVSAVPAGRAEPGDVFDRLPRIAEQRGTVAERLGQVHDLDGWSAAASGLRPAREPDEVRRRLADVVAAATLRYLDFGHGQPVLLVHTATAPNAVLHILPALPTELWEPSLAAVWTATAAIFSGYAPTGAAPPPRPVTGADTVAEVIDRAVAHGDEHVIKFTDTAAEVYTRTGDPGALTAAGHAARLIQPG